MIILRIDPGIAIVGYDSIKSENGCVAAIEPNKQLYKNFLKAREI